MYIHGEPGMSTNTTSASAEQRLKDLGINLPRPSTPLGTYVEAVQAGNLLFLSGTLPVEGGAPKFLGRIGGELSVEDGRRATRLAALKRSCARQGVFGVAGQSDARSPSRGFTRHDSRVP